MRRVVVTGMGIVSSIGTNKGEVLASLRSGRSGIEFAPEYQALGFRSQVHGPIRVKREELIDRKPVRSCETMLSGSPESAIAWDIAI